MQRITAINRYLPLITAWACLLLLGSALAPGMAAGTAADTTNKTTTVTLDPSAPHYFRLYTGSSLLLALQSDGSYVLVDRNKYRVTESDRGTWTASDDGAVSVTSQKNKMPIKSEPFTLQGITKDNESELPGIADKLARFLTQVKDPTISATVFQKEFSTRDQKLNPSIDGSRLYKTSSIDAVVSRAEVERLLETLKATDTRTTPSSAAFRPWRWKDITFLERADISDLHWTGFSNYSAPRAAIGAFKRFGQPGRNVFVQIDEETFRHEVMTVQEPLYVPDLKTTCSTVKAPLNPDEFPDPAKDPIGALGAAVTGFVHHATSSTADLAGIYRNPGPILRGGLSGYDLYLFPDGTYFYLNWADIMPRRVTSRGTWSVANGYVAIHPDGVLDSTRAFAVEQAYMPISMVVDKVIVKQPTAITGLLGFPRGYESFFSNPDMESLYLTHVLLERSGAIDPAEVDALKERLLHPPQRNRSADKKQTTAPLIR